MHWSPSNFETILPMVKIIIIIIFLINFVVFRQKNWFFSPSANSTNFANLLRKIDQICDITKLEQNLKNTGVWCKIAKWQVLTKSTKFVNFWEFIWQVYNISKLKRHWSVIPFVTKQEGGKTTFVFLFEGLLNESNFQACSFLSKICHTIARS